MIRKLFSFALWKSLVPPNWILHKLLDGSVERELPLATRPVFIVGAPRCGSTLTYQVFVDVFDFGYLSNLHALCYGMPELVERLLRPRKWHRQGRYESRLGRTSRWSDPCECGRFWYRFFPRGASSEDLIQTPDHKLQSLRSAVVSFTRSCSKSVLFKNLYSSLRITPLITALPEALFIVVHRNEIDLGHSLLESRYDTFGRYEHWFSVPPPHVHDLLARPAHEQVIEQVRGIYSEIDRQRRLVGPDRFFDVHYERFTASPVEVLDECEAFFLRHGLSFERRRVFLPSFERRRKIRIDTNLYERMCRYARASD